MQLRRNASGTYLLVDAHGVAERVIPFEFRPDSILFKMRRKG